MASNLQLEPPGSLDGDNTRLTEENKPPQNPKPVVTWNAVRPGTIRTKLLGSRKPSGTPQVPASNLTTSTTPRLPTQASISPLASYATPPVSSAASLAPNSTASEEDEKMKFTAVNKNPNPRPIEQSIGQDFTGAANQYNKHQPLEMKDGNNNEGDATIAQRDGQQASVETLPDFKNNTDIEIVTPAALVHNPKVSSAVTESHAQETTNPQTGRSQGVTWNDLNNKTEKGPNQTKIETGQEIRHHSKSLSVETFATAPVRPSTASEVDAKQLFVERRWAQPSAQISDLAQNNRDAPTPSSTSMGNGNGVILNVVQQEQDSTEDGELPDAPAAEFESASSLSASPTLIPAKRSFDEAIRANDSDSDSNREEEMDIEEGEVSSEEDESASEEGEIEPTEEDSTESSEEGEIDEDPASASSESGEILEDEDEDPDKTEDALLLTYSDSSRGTPHHLSHPSVPHSSTNQQIPISSSPSSPHEPSPFPNLSPSLGPTLLSDLPHSQLLVQLRYFHPCRSPSQIPSSTLVRCTICSIPGHIRRYCPSAKCPHCGAFASHFVRSCPQAPPRCSRCRGTHTLSSCPHKLKPDNLKLVCDMCGEEGHAEEDCELVWRSSGAIWQTPLDAGRVMRLCCYECGIEGHLGNDCPQRRPGKEMGSSTWSLKGLPVPVQGIGKIEPGLVRGGGLRRGGGRGKVERGGKRARATKRERELGRGGGRKRGRYEEDEDSDDGVEFVRASVRRAREGGGGGEVGRGGGGGGKGGGKGMVINIPPARGAEGYSGGRGGRGALPTPTSSGGRNSQEGSKKEYTATYGSRKRLRSPERIHGGGDSYRPRRGGGGRNEGRRGGGGRGGGGGGKALE